MDAAEAWLREHDPRYDQTKAGWKHLVDGQYETPRQEVPFGNAADLEALKYSVAPDGRRRQLDWYAELDQARERDCVECGVAFMPYKADHLYHSQRCHRRAYMRRWRERREP